MSDDNIIHVSFGKARGRLPSGGPPGPSGPHRGGRRTARDPLAQLYTVGDAAKLFGCSTSRLRYWDRSGFIKPSAVSEGRRYYTFQDLISIRAAKGLLDKGVSLRNVRRSVEALKGSLPRVARPLSELRVIADGDAVLVRHEQGAFEPTTGQLVLDFRVDALREDVVRVLRSGERSTSDRRHSAYEHYLEGCRLDEDEATFDRAEEAYKRALTLDPTLANALTNLGNLRYRRGFEKEAEEMYRQAIGIDPAQPEALYNMGFLRYERAEPDQAAEWFRRALQSDPSFADAHFNLAMVYEDLGQHDTARPHWQTYLTLDPEGPWAEVARKHLP